MFMSPTRRVSTLLIISVFIFHSIAFAQSQSPIDGFNRESSDTERNFEGRFRAIPSSGSASKQLHLLTAEPHIAGSKEDYATAIYVRDQMRSYGLNAEVAAHQVLLNYT